MRKGLLGSIILLAVSAVSSHAQVIYYRPVQQNLGYPHMYQVRKYPNQVTHTGRTQPNLQHPAFRQPAPRNPGKYYNVGPLPHYNPNQSNVQGSPRPSSFPRFRLPSLFRRNPSVVHQNAQQNLNQNIQPGVPHTTLRMNLNPQEVIPEQHLPQSESRTIDPLENPDHFAGKEVQKGTKPRILDRVRDFFRPKPLVVSQENETPAPVQKSEVFAGEVENQEVLPNSRKSKEQQEGLMVNGSGVPISPNQPWLQQTLPRPGRPLPVAPAPVEQSQSRPSLRETFSRLFR